MAEIQHWDRVVALAKVSMANPIAAAVLRLHSDRDGAGSCAECTGEYGVPWPCPTVLVIEQAAAEQEQEALDALDFMAQIHAQVAGLDAGAITRPKEPTDG
jgi:hypothetical protein